MSENNVTKAPAKEVVITLTLEETNIVLAGLSELPAKHSLTLIEKVKSQAMQQLNLQQS